MMKKTIIIWACLFTVGIAGSLLEDIASCQFTPQSCTPDGEECIYEWECV